MMQEQQQQSRNPVVATLANPSQHPYSSISLSPDRSHAVVAGKDNLQLLSVSPHGLSEIRNVRIAHRFLHTASASASASASAITQTTLSTKRYGDIRDTFNLRAAGPAQTMMPNASAVVTDVAWSAVQSDGSQVIAAAGSNGLIVVWDALDLMTGVNPAIGPQPEAVLSQHSMPVNRLAWHPSSNKAGLLLSASQDETVKLWVRHISESPRQQKETPRSWFSLPSQETPLVARRSYSWQCITTFEPRAAVRDIQWSPFQDDVFAMVTQTGSLLIYKINVPGTPWVRILAHANEATTVDWHPTLPFIIATGGGDDRTVKSK
jgi:WD repeat-containing protein 24